MIGILRTTTGHAKMILAFGSFSCQTGQMEVLLFPTGSEPQAWFYRSWQALKCRFSLLHILHQVAQRFTFIKHSEYGNSDC